MATSTANSCSPRVCAHCGLFITAAPLSQNDSEPIFCCHACRLASLIIGKGQPGKHTASLLRLAFGALLAMNVMMISLLLYTDGVESRLVPTFRLLLLALSTPALAILIPPFLSEAMKEIKGGKASLDTLIACGSLSAFAFSSVSVIRGSGDIYFDTATMLPVLVTFGKLIEASAKSRAADLLCSLQSLLPSRALRATATGVEEVPLEAIAPGDLVRIRPGERVPVDGRIVEGVSSIEEAAFTGEFLPRLCRRGDRVIAGTVNGTGSLLVRAERTGLQLLLHGIVNMIRDAWLKPSRAERIAQRAATLFIPVVLAVAAAAALWWAAAGHPGQALLSALSVLVVACPCTMGIATPLATSLAISRAGKAGIVVRGGSVMEQIAATERCFFDKTGTITEGKPELEGIVLLDPKLDQSELLGRLAALEAASEHALGKAIVAAAAEHGVEPGSAAEVTVSPGHGLKGRVTWRGTSSEVMAGSGTYLGNGGELSAACGTFTAVEVAWDGTAKGRLLFADAVREDAGLCVAALSELGISCALLSGDRFAAAQEVAGQVGIEEVHAPHTPAEKRAVISAALAAGHTVAMVGDGINDAPALAQAPIGIALGAGMELAKQAGNVVIVSGSLLQIPWLVSLSRRTGKIIRTNFAWSFAYNGVALAAAAAGLLHPLLAALAMVGSSLTVLGNSLRITAFPAPPSSREGKG
ncbi:cation-translocating P-type ATPase [Geomonas sp.]|uniref:heavy metal translocating P-type ATPase n=1 Tax=Geomonas sp. TaxID=2651584 RepID=UPI002B4627DC|nr:cation-translocating P-type ATPase [Geomonas sp.]HJV34193.1 cation-translocating P-type ATPase [Geomonas sp.]